MHEILEWIALEEVVPTIVLMCLLRFIAEKLGEPEPVARQGSKRLAAVAFVGYEVLGIGTWKPRSMSELLEITIRAVLAAGIVHATSLVTWPLLEVGYQHTFGRLKKTFDDWSSRSRARLAAWWKQRADAARETMERKERERLSLIHDGERRQQAEAAKKQEEARKTSVNDAQVEVTNFYEENKNILSDLLPASLLKSQLQNRFPVGISAEQAWQAAQEIISAMVSLAAQGREQQRVKQEETRKQTEETAERARKLPENQREAVHKLGEWYEREKHAMEQRLPPGPDRDDILATLLDRYDELMKQALREMKP